jgi:hypothetical protein
MWGCGCECDRGTAVLWSAEVALRSGVFLIKGVKMTTKKILKGNRERRLETQTLNRLKWITMKFQRP